jgi:hypothetical protein
MTISMLNDASQPTALTLQPFRLLDLPRELLVTVFRSYRSPIIDDHGDGIFIYAGEQHVGRYDILRRLCLTHRDILPFAQAELFKRLDISSDRRVSLLNASIAGSERCKEYAGRAESIFLGGDVDADGLMECGDFNPRELNMRRSESGDFNPRELNIRRSIKFSLLSRSRLIYDPSVALTLMLSTDRFQTLRQVHVYNPTYDEALVLPNLETYSVSLNDPSHTYNASREFEPVNLPNLRRLDICTHAMATVSFGKFYDSVISQLDHLHLCSPCTTDLEHLLLIPTSLQSFHVKYDKNRTESSKLSSLLHTVDSKALHYTRSLAPTRASDLFDGFESVEKMKAALEGNDHIKQVELTYYFDFTCLSTKHWDRAFALWNELKEELTLICAKREIEIINLQCPLLDEENLRWRKSSLPSMSFTPSDNICDVALRLGDRILNSGRR